MSQRRDQLALPSGPVGRNARPLDQDRAPAARWLAHGVGGAAGLLALQRAAGNAAAGRAVLARCTGPGCLTDEQLMDAPPATLSGAERHRRSLVYQRDRRRYRAEATVREFAQQLGALHGRLRYLISSDEEDVRPRDERREAEYWWMPAGHGRWNRYRREVYRPNELEAALDAGCVVRDAGRSTLKAASSVAGVKARLGWLSAHVLSHVALELVQRCVIWVDALWSIRGSSRATTVASRRLRKWGP